MAPIFSRFYRILFCRSGYGVHSPFAFDLITTVIEERQAYYCYEMLDNIRLQLQKENRKMRYGRKDLTIKKILHKDCFSVRGYRLLFRLTNYFRSEKVLIIGSGLGLAPLYATAYSRKTDCIVFEPEPSIAVIARNVVKKYACSPIKIYDKIFDESDAPELKNADFIIWGNVSVESSDRWKTVNSFGFFENMLPYVTDKSIMVICGIHDSSARKQIWKEVCAHPEVSVTFDLYSLGLVFFNSKLHRKTYKSIYM
jgi:hypothetical protein